MLNVEINDGIAKMEIKGTTKEITADVLVIIQQIYEVMKKRNKECAELFYDGIKDNLEMTKLDHKELSEKVESVEKEEILSQIKKAETMIRKLKKELQES